MLIYLVLSKKKTDSGLRLSSRYGSANHGLVTLIRMAIGLECGGKQKNKKKIRFGDNSSNVEPHAQSPEVKPFE